MPPLLLMLQWYILVLKVTCQQHKDYCFNDHVVIGVLAQCCTHHSGYGMYAIILACTSP